MLKSALIKATLLVAFCISLSTPLHADDLYLDLDSQLIIAVSQNETKQIQSLLKQGANIEVRDAQGATSIIMASRLGFNEVVKLLIKHKANINAIDESFKDTALKWAAFNGHMPVVQTLLTHKANVHSRDKEGNTALIDAARRGHATIAELLITHGANINDQNYKGQTPFSIAKSHGYTEVMTMLRKHKADEELGEDPQSNNIETLLDQLNDLPIPKDDKREIRRQILNLDNSSAYEKPIAQEFINLVFALPWGKTTQDNYDLINAKKILDEDHYGLKDVKEKILDFIASLNFKKDGKAPILCLVGPPGIGKTSLGKSVARALGRKYERFAVGGLHDESELRGHRRTYIGARCGRIIQTMKHAQSLNPVVLIDEIDKLGRHGYHGDPAAALLEILDPEQNKAFRDNYLEMPFDLSQVLFIATANDASSIPHALYDRMEIIYLSSYSEDEKLAIIEQHLLKQAIKDAGLESKKITLSQDVLKKIIKDYSQEAGVRQVKRLLATLMAKIARGLLEKKKLIDIDTKNLEKHLGPIKHLPEEIDNQPRIGVVNGLYASAFGGGLTKIETTMFPRAPQENPLQLTGQLQAVAQESAQAALSYARSCAQNFNIDAAVFANNTIHINFAGFFPKDGPSAGAALVTSIISTLTNQPVNPHYAMTGTINLRGNVGEIGGLKEKILGAKRHGIKYILIPYDNKRDLDELNETEKSVTNGVEIILVKHVDEVLKRVLM